MKTKLLVTLLSMFSVCGFAWGQDTYHVSTTGNDASNGLSQAEAMLSIEVAVAAAGDGDTILLGDGIHNVTSRWVQVNKAIILTSENGPEATALKAAYATTNQRRVIQVTHADALITGLTLRDGNNTGAYDATTAGGVTLSAGSVSNCVIQSCKAMVRGGVQMTGGLLTHCLLEDNGTLSGGTDREGGGVYATSGTIQFCRLVGNSAPRGGGIRLAGASVIVRDCELFGNSINSGNSGCTGGGIYMDSGLVDRCLVATNTSATFGGGIEIQGGLVRNCLVVNNTANSGGGGIRLGNINGRLTSTTIANNVSLLALVGHGLYMTTGIASNIVVHGNGKAPFRYGPDNVYKSGGTLVYSCTPLPLQDGAGNMAADPMFVNPEAGDFKLQPASPCRDASPSAPGVTVDLKGNPRPVDGTGDSVVAFDMGCYEAATFGAGPLTCGFSVIPAEGAGSVTASFAAYADGADTAISLYTWNFGDGSPAQSGASLAIVSHSYTPGFYDVTLTVNNATEETTLIRTDAVRVGASVAYVVPDGGQGVAPYDTWDKAATNIQHAIDNVWATNNAPGTVRVADGTYNLGTLDRVTVLRNVNLQSVNGPEVTILDGQNISNRRVMFVNHAGADVSGFTLRNGNYPQTATSEGGGLRLENGIVSNCLILANSGRYAGGIGMSSGLLTDCVISNNAATDNGASGLGGGIYMTGGTVQRCLITTNKANLGGGIYMAAGTLRNCVVTRNTGSYYGANITYHGGGIRMTGGAVWNVLCAENSTKHGSGGGLYMSGAGSTVVNATICDNTSASAGGGIYQTAGSIRNTIAYYNINEDLVKTDGTITYSSVGNDAVPAGDGNINLAPFMPKRATGDYRLSFGSPGIDTGIDTGWTLDDVDLAGMPRLKFQGYDMGAYEFQGATGTFISVR